MTSRAHVVRRGERSAQERFPAQPTLPFDAPCDGVAFLSEHGLPAPELRGVREITSGIWRGRLGAAPDAPHLLVAAFTTPAVLDMAWAVSGLPLRSSGDGLASFVEDLATAPAPSGARHGPRWLELWWKGHRHRLALDSLEAVSIATLWDAPRLHVHAPKASADRNASSKDAVRPDGMAKIARTPFVLRREAGDPVAEVEARLRGIEERTRLSSIFKQLFRQRIVGKGGAAEAADDEPGVLENLKGWLQWHTPLGAGLRGKFSERMATVERLLAGGDLDTALKLALALGADATGGKRSLFPSALPGQRASLDLTIDGRGAAPILGQGAYAGLQERYTALARKLEADGDFRRAAYVHSKLLNDHRQAALVLERGGLFSEAAKLAMAAPLEPVLTIRLLFKADELAAALNLAKRTGCFDQLAEDSREKEKAFHAYVVEAWTETLIATNQPLRALQVTDRLAERSDAQRGLHENRRRWLDLAGELEEPGSPAPELMARAMLIGAWDLDAELDGFPQAPVRPGQVGALREAAARAVRGEGEAPEETLVALLHHLARLAGPKREEQAAFWRGPAQVVLESLVLALLGQASERLGVSELEAMRGLLERAELPVLALDLGKVTKLHARPSPKTRTWRVPPATTVQPAFRAACVLGTGQVLAWRESRLLQLFDRHGGVVWQQNVSDVAALTPIGGGADAIVIQHTADGAHQLTRFSSRKRSFHPIGKVRLSACHDLTSDGQWLVQIAGEIGALDLEKLCLPSPEIEFLWSSQLTDRVRAIGFGHQPDRPQWLTRDVSEGRYGVLEHWSLERTGKLTTTICIPSAPDSPTPRPPARWFWAPQQNGAMIRTASTGETMWTALWTVEAERKAMDYARQRAAQDIEGLDVFQSCDFARPHVTIEVDAERGTMRTGVVASATATPRFVFEHAADKPLACLARSAVGSTQGAGRVVFADDAGRLFMLDLESLGVLVA